jgi:hypothetical protein
MPQKATVYGRFANHALTESTKLEPQPIAHDLSENANAHARACIRTVASTVVGTAPDMFWENLDQTPQMMMVSIKYAEKRLV